MSQTARIHRINQRQVCLCAGAPFQRKLPPRDLQPQVTDLWRILSRLSVEDPDSLSLHRGPLGECLEMLERAYELSKEDVR